MQLSKKGEACQKRDPQRETSLYAAFLYELLYLTITICVCSIATTTVGTIIGEAS